MSELFLLLWLGCFPNQTDNFCANRINVRQFATHESLIHFVGTIAGKWGSPYSMEVYQASNKTKYTLKKNSISTFFYKRKNK